MLESYDKLIPVIQCPECKDDIPLFFYPYEGMIIHGCGCVIGNIIISPAGAAMGYTEAGSPSLQAKFDAVHKLDDRLFTGLDDVG